MRKGCGVSDVLIVGESCCMKSSLSCRPAIVAVVPAFAAKYCRSAASHASFVHRMVQHAVLYRNQDKDRKMKHCI